MAEMLELRKNLDLQEAETIENTEILEIGTPKETIAIGTHAIVTPGIQDLTVIAIPGILEVIPEESHAILETHEIGVAVQDGHIWMVRRASRLRSLQPWPLLTPTKRS